MLANVPTWLLAIGWVLSFSLAGMAGWFLVDKPCLGLVLLILALCFGSILKNG